MSEPKNVLIKLCLPLEHKDAGNRLAYIIDPGPRGDQTFANVLMSASGAEPATHVMCETWMREDYAALLREKNPAEIMTALSALAVERDRPAPVQSDIDAFCANVLIDDEITVQRIPPAEDAGAGA